MLFGPAVVYAAASASDSDGSDLGGVHENDTGKGREVHDDGAAVGGGGAGAEACPKWWERRGAYVDAASRPGIVDSILKLRGRGGLAHPAHYPLLSLTRQYRGRAGKRAPRRNASKRRRPSPPRSPTSPARTAAAAAAANSRTPPPPLLPVSASAAAAAARLDAGMAMYWGRRRESALASLVDGEVARALSTATHGSGSGPTAAAFDAHSPTTPSGAAGGCSGSLSAAASAASARHAARGIRPQQLDFFSAVTDAPLPQQPATQPADDNVSETRMWDRIIKRCNSHVPVLTRQGRRALSLAEHGRLSSLITSSGSLESPSPPADATARHEAGGGWEREEREGAAADASSSSGALTAWDSCGGRTLDLAHCIDTVLSQLE